MKSHGVYRARADLQKCGFCEEKLAGSVYMLVKLQRPPPDMRIFLPALLEWSMSSTWRPRAAAVMAHIRPAAPAPMITTAVFSSVPGLEDLERRAAVAVVQADVVSGEHGGAVGAPLELEALDMEAAHDPVLGLLERPHRRV